MRLRRCGPVVAALMALLLLVQWVAPARAQQSAPGVVTAICTDPGICFKSKEARQKWAKDHNCQFLEDVCEKTPVSEDNKGAKPADQGFWSSLWDKVSGAVQYGYEFSKGLFNGLKGQIVDVIELISNPAEVAAGLVKLGKAFYDDPKGTLAALGQLLGQEAVDTITKATQCGAYDLGNVIGSYVSPAVALKLAIKLGKFTGKLADAVKATKADLGCASFGAGTPVHAGGDLTAIEAVRQGAIVDSRDEVRWTDAPQRVTNTFGRIAPGHRELLTELEAFRITDEHPLWVQGKGWTAAKEIAEGDVLAAREGDLLVRSNTAVPKPLAVYNFSVANTPNYFIGEAGLWAHNAKCDLTLTKDIMESKVGLLGPLQKGFYGEVKVVWFMKEKGFTPVQAIDPDKPGAFDQWKGTTGIDGIFKDKNGQYVIVESKATGSQSPKDPCGGSDKLCTLVGGERQMSNAWIMERIKDLPDDDQAAIAAQMNNGTLTRVYAKTDGNGNTTYNKIISKGGPKNNKDATDITAEIGDPWTP